MGPPKNVRRLEVTPDEQSVTAQDLWARNASAPVGAVLRVPKRRSHSHRTLVAACQSLLDWMTWRRAAFAASRSASHVGDLGGRGRVPVVVGVAVAVVGPVGAAVHRPRRELRLRLRLPLSVHSWLVVGGLVLVVSLVLVLVLVQVLVV